MGEIRNAPRTRPEVTKTLGQGEEKSRQKAQKAHERAVEQIATAEPDGWPRGVSGQPMMKIVMTAAELIPTGQFANVSIGPVQITAFVDQDRKLPSGETYFSGEQRDTMALALNELAEIVEGDVVAVQRNLVLESMQDQIGR